MVAEPGLRDVDEPVAGNLAAAARPLRLLAWTGLEPVDQVPAVARAEQLGLDGGQEDSGDVRAPDVVVVGVQVPDLGPDSFRALLPDLQVVGHDRTIR